MRDYYFDLIYNNKESFGSFFFYLRGREEGESFDEID